MRFSPKGKRPVGVCTVAHCRQWSSLLYKANGLDVEFCEMHWHQHCQEKPKFIRRTVCTSCVGVRT